MTLMVTSNSPNWKTHGFFGGHVVLDFVNTVDDIEKTRDVDAIPDWPSALAWCAASELLTRSEIAELASAEMREPAEKELTELHEIRERLWRIFGAIGRDEDIGNHDVRDMEADIRWMVAGAALGRAGRGLSWHSSVADFGVSVIRARIVGEALDLLIRGDLKRLKECGRCTGLFLDFGRGVGRKWCRMETCGNREKVARHRRDQ